VFFLPDGLGNEGPILHSGAVRECGELREVNLVDVLSPAWVGLRAATSSLELGRAVVPDAMEGSSAHQSGSGRSTWPAVGPVDEAFFESLAKDVPKAARLAFRVGHHNGPVTPGPEGALPSVMLSDLLRDVGQDMLHEPCKLGGMVDAEQGVHVIAHDGEGVDADAVEVLGASHDPEYKVIRGGIRPEKEPASYGAGSDLDDGSRGDVTERTWHGI
jgi:hypothetical protein